MHYALAVVVRELEELAEVMDVYVHDSEQHSFFNDMTEDIKIIMEEEGRSESLEEFAINSGYVEMDGKYGFYYNPNGVMDYYEIGGRYKEALLVKRDAKDCHVIGASPYEEDYQPKLAPEGYLWVDAARLKDIDWEKMKELDEPILLPTSIVDSCGQWHDIMPSILPKFVQPAFMPYWEHFKGENPEYFLVMIDYHE